MFSALSSARLSRSAVLVLPWLALILAGCEDSYPSDLTYPLRTDPIVTDLPTNNPFFPTGPGELDANIARFGPTTDGGIGGKTLNPQALPDKDRQDLTTALLDAFGTPAGPRVECTDDDAKKQAAALKLDRETLKAGSKLYRRHCLHCHGLDGDGRGPTGPWISPHPRDYRQGLFKFISTDASVRGRKPRRDDLRRTLDRGIEGTSMPSFGLFSDSEKEELISYVIHLSLRGEVELDTMKNLLNAKGRSKLEGGNEDMKEHVQTQLAYFLGYWANSNGKVMEPEPYPIKDEDPDKKKKLEASIRRGYALFTDPKAASCINCHLDFGRQPPFRYDDWGSLVRPANLTAGVYRGGRRPIDLYWRIKGGIPGTPMPKAEFPAGTDKSADPAWDLVNFVQALPYPLMLPEGEIRDRIYPQPGEVASGHLASR